MKVPSDPSRVEVELLFSFPISTYPRHLAFAVMRLLYKPFFSFAGSVAFLRNVPFITMRSTSSFLA